MCSYCDKTHKKYDTNNCVVYLEDSNVWVNIVPVFDSENETTDYIECITSICPRCRRNLNN
ncbi:MAG: hypothetical protein ACRDD7_01450 [Peptostreptococcaceae bacterium]